MKNKKDNIHNETSPQSDVRNPQSDVRNPQSAIVCRREFLEILSASFATLALAGCEFRAPREKVFPYMEQPEEIIPGVVNWYATTCAGCAAGCGLLVKNRDGRPIKIEGNPEHPLSKGGVCARGHATVLDLYDSERYKEPRMKGSPTAWQEVDASLMEELLQIKNNGGQIRIVTSTLLSPTARESIKKFIRRYPTTRLVTYDAMSCSAILESHQISHGQAILPHYRFDKAKSIVSFDADFLGTWISPVEFMKAWQSGRDPGHEKKPMSWHAQFETRMSLTGANADLRVPILPSQSLAAILELAKLIAKRVGWIEARQIPSAGKSGVPPDILEAVAERLASVRGHCLVVSGVNDINVQLVVNFINYILDNYGDTVDIVNPSYQAQGIDSGMEKLISEMDHGVISALIVSGANPAYDHPAADAFKNALKNVYLTVSLNSRKDETSELVKYICPDHHYLEAWGDANPQMGLYSITQPVLAPIFSTRSAVETFLTWGDIKKTAYNFIREYWEKNIYPNQSEYTDFQSYWDKSVQDGVAIIENERLTGSVYVKSSIEKIKPPVITTTGGDYELVAYPGVALSDGRQANNPWLQELPDPITKVTWGNCASISPATAQKLKVKEGRVLEISSGDKTVKLPVYIQPGMPDNSIAAALGYGRPGAGKIAANYPIEKMFPVEKEFLSGGNVYPFVGVGKVKIKKSTKISPLAKTQTYEYAVVPFTGQERTQIKETTLEAYSKNHRAGNEEHHEKSSLWKGHQYKKHKWAMVIDLNKCTGCSSCIISCQAENNVPVVGKAEVRKRREMHWMRIDRYYSGSAKKQDENSSVSFQPVLCQQCDNAPCETVCPVLATLHSSEGLNMQIYNRCVGTRYCANNCPYKVRRFNWFDYSHTDLVQNLVLNPEITVRTRGIMEKCSFCAQRIAEGKRRAKFEGRKLKDDDIQPACQQSCPAEAIIFGDINNPSSKVSEYSKNPRSYTVLADIGVRPSIFYFTKVRNKIKTGQEDT